MKSNKEFCLVAALLWCVTLFSQNQTITMKDGTVYDGFISSQNYQTGYGEISYSRMTKTIQSEDVYGKRTEKKELSSLPEAWQKWAIENNKVEVTAGGKYLSLTTMSVGKRPNAEYYILVSGAKTLTAFTISEGSETIKMSEIQSIRKAERDKTLLTDVDDILQTENATYTGVLLEQIPGVSFTIWSKSDHAVHQIDYADVCSVGKGRFNQDYSIWQQTPYLDKVHFKNRMTGDGLIIENGFGRDINILFAEKSGESTDVRQYKYSDIISIERFRNPEYVPLYDIVLKEGESRINRDSVLVRAETVMIRNSDSTKFFVIDPKNTDFVAVVDTCDVFIETNTPEFSDVYIAKARVLENMPLSLLPEKNEEEQSGARKILGASKKEDTTADLYCYTYMTLFESEIDSKVETSINGTTKISFKLPETGVYFVYLRRQGVCWAISYQK